MQATHSLQNPRYRGIFPVVPTTFHEDGTLDLDSQKRCLDFMIDDAYRPFLIEVNTNPCLELSSPLLEKLIPRMVDDALALTVDQFFPPPKDRKETYSVEGYPDGSNMWIRTV